MGAVRPYHPEDTVTAVTYSGPTDTFIAVGLYKGLQWLAAVGP
jgi:hypothetical protein